MDSLIFILLLVAVITAQAAVLVHLNHRLLVAKDRLADARRNYLDTVASFRAARERNDDMRRNVIEAAGNDTNRPSVRRMLEILKGPDHA